MFNVIRNVYPLAPLTEGLEPSTIWMCSFISMEEHVERQPPKAINPNSQ